jgi:hypothetical protein
MLLQLQNGEPFATGATNYDYRPATKQENTPRIIVSVMIKDIRTLAFVDTGGVYAICSPTIANGLNLNPRDGFSTAPILWRGERYEGFLHTLPMTILAEDGVSLQIEPTFFVPQLTVGQTWGEDLPCILGMYLCLDRLRFAVDPSMDTFYFGELT